MERLKGKIIDMFQPGMAEALRAANEEFWRNIERVRPRIISEDSFVRRRVDEALLLAFCAFKAAYHDLPK